MNLQRNWGGRTLAVKAEQNAFTSLGMKADLKCETTDLLQSRQKGSAEAELPIHVFGNDGRVLVEKPIFRSLAVKIERKCRSETANLWKSRQRWNAEAELHIFGRPGRTSAESRTSDLCQSRQSGIAEAEHHMFGSQCRTKVRTWNFRSLAVKTERKRNFRYVAVKAKRKCGSGTSGLWQSRQSRSVEADFQNFSRQDRAEVRKQQCSTADVWQASQVGRAEADLNNFDRPISYWLSLPMLKNNSTDCSIEGQCEDHMWLKHDFRNVRDKVNMLLQGLWVILDWTLS